MKNTAQPLLEEYQIGNLKLKNRVIMSSLTRGRATNEGLVPTPLMAAYYAQRASAGLILSEGTWVNPRSIGFINVPGIYTPEQIEGWKLVTQAVHDKGGLIFSQLGHIGAASHPDFFGGELPAGPSAINPQTQSFTPEGFKDTVTPRMLTVAEIKQTILDYKQAAKNAKEAGFDGIEVHAQAGMLIPQFLSLATNKRSDEYGGSVENRARIVFEILDAIIEVWDSTRVAIKFTPVLFSHVGIVTPDEETIPLFQYILKKLSDYNLAYLHIVGPAEDLTGTPVEVLQDDYFSHFRYHYSGTLMANLGFTQGSGNAILKDGKADLVSFGTPFIANPDLVKRFMYNLPLAESNRDTYYSGESGYTDYPEAVIA
ncbi:alkene reductase [Chitinophaga pinensis]|uniref:NADH:flavin oxidoreductase/NADH oxidase n=1 Tax=Chitinophaga pinensis (strain ATCC 43595 / DSM 2588 / LMG 13176 / NBRC 15968 / NCIMB 11800 / UQM 2034) TaxID=485918 RepID=A0A979GY74_CHIPD|nr:alkene reductase [Chitinophaga pinensis]ACU61715.1 NADH:flavin oxidoreductase/NADH oxidase [Chitinophaga pinensis DSM 2588]